MACSSAASKFTVRRRPSVLVAPAASTPRELKRLSDIDQEDRLWCQFSNLHFYRRNESMGGKDPVGVIREALAKALVPSYPFAGWLREHCWSQAARLSSDHDRRRCPANATNTREHGGTHERERKGKYSLRDVAACSVFD